MKKDFKKLLAFTRLVKPFAQIWTRAMTWQSSCTRNLRKPSFANAHSYSFTRLVKPLTAFTLAEVLITLSILGVVAAITVPSLINHQHRNEVETKIRKMYSTVSYVLDTAEANEGKGFASWDAVPSLTADAAVAFTTKYFLPYLNVQKNCMVDGDCQSYTRYYPDAKTFKETGAPRLILKDGTYFWASAKLAAGMQYVEDGNLYITFDINGAKGPNAFGKDIFQIIIFEDTKTGSYYFGSASLNKADYNLANAIKKCKTISGNNHQYCMGWIYANGLKIPKDYPWL